MDLKFLVVLFLLFATPVCAATQIQLRRGAAANWTSVNPILAQGEVGYETDTNKFKIGDGVSNWTSLGYFSSGEVGSGSGDVDGGSAASEYLLTQNLDGGDADGS